MTELQEKVRQVIGVPVSKEKYTVDDWFTTWLENYVKPLKEQATYDQYSILYKGHVEPCIGKRKLNNIKSVDIQGVISKMNAKKLSSATMKHVRKILHIGFDKALKDNILSKNPVVNIEIPKTQPKRRKTLTPDEMVKLFKALAHSRWIWSVKFMLVTGLRRGELLALEWVDVDFENKRLRIKASNSKKGLKETKSAQERMIPLSKAAITYLVGQRNMLLDEGLEKATFVFPNNKGEVMGAGSYYTAIARLGKNVEVAVSPHCLRHTFVFINRHDLDIKDLQRILGHAESTQTLDIYGDIINDRLDENVTAMDSAYVEFDNKVKEAKRQADELENKVEKKVVNFENYRKK